MLIKFAALPWLLICGNTSFKSGRYFGSASESIRVSRQIEVMLQPPYLISHRQAKQLDDFKSMKGNKDNEIIQAA